MASVPALTDLTVSDLWKEVKDEATLWGDISRESLRAVKCLLEHRMEDELTHYLKAASYNRSPYRRGYRNGAYIRRLTTTWGTFPLTIPRARVHGFTPSVLPRYQRRTDRVNHLVRSVFLGGVSTRQVGPLLADLLEDRLSATTVSAITRTFDQAVAAFHHRPLADEWIYLFLDAVSLRTKTPDGTRRRVALVAYGMTPDGRRQLLDFRLVRTEGLSTWETFLLTLAARGLTGTSCASSSPTATAASMPPSTTSIPTFPARPAGSTSCAMSPTACASVIGTSVCVWPAASIKPGPGRPRSAPSSAGAKPGSAPPPTRSPPCSETGMRC